MTTSPTIEKGREVARHALVARRVRFDDIPRSCWERLLSLTASPSPFSRWTFHRAWWDAYGETAHEEYLVCLPAAAEATERIEWELVIAIVPLMHRHEVEPDDILNKTTLRESDNDAACRSVPPDAKAIFFGASYHADYATILSAAEDLEPVTAAVADALAGPPDPQHGSRPWDVVDLRRLRSTDPALPALEQALRAANPGWDVVRESEDVCPVVTAPSGDWDEYLATLDKKDRHEIRRKLRRAAVVGTLSIEISPPTPEALDRFIELHNKRFGDRGLFPDGPGGDRSRRFIHRLGELEASAPDAQLHVAVVGCGARSVWTVLAFDDGETCYLYNAGMDPDASAVSPGITGTAEYFRDRLAAGRRRFDFLRGNEPYKYEWGGRDEPIERLLVLREAAA